MLCSNFLSHIRIAAFRATSDFREVFSWHFEKLIIAHRVSIEKGREAIRRASLPMARALIF